MFETGPFRIIFGREPLIHPWWKVIQVRRLWSVAVLRHGVGVRCRVEVPSWVRVRSIGVMREGYLDWSDHLIIGHRAKWWCFWREWKP